MTAVWRVHYLWWRLRLWFWATITMLGAPVRVVRSELPPEMAKLTPGSAGVDYLDVSVWTELGKLPVWWIPGSSERYAVLLHGRAGDRIGLIDLIKPLHDAGMNVLIPMIRNDLGAPSSPDGLDHLGATEWEDLHAVVEQVVNMGGEEVVLFARSAGAAIVGQFLSRSKHASMVSRIVYDNPVLDWRAVFRNARPRWMPQWVADIVIWWNARRVGVRMGQFDMAAEPPLIRPPTLIIHSADDEVCPIGVSYRVRDAAPKNWNVVVMPMLGGHAGARFDNPKKYLPVAVEWLTGSVARAEEWSRLGTHSLQALLTFLETGKVRNANSGTAGEN